MKGKELQTLLKTQGITGVRLAEMLNTTPQSINWLFNRPELDWSKIKEVAEVTGIPLDKLVQADKDLGGMFLQIDKYRREVEELKATIREREETIKQLLAEKKREEERADRLLALLEKLQ